MNKQLNLTGYDSITENLETFCQSQGYTLNDTAELYQDFLLQAERLYVNGVLTAGELGRARLRIIKMIHEKAVRK